MILISTRYFILIHQDKEYLKYCLNEIEKKIKEEKLELNQKTQIFSIKEGVTFLGYRFKLKGKKLLILLNSQSKKRIRKKLNYLSKIRPVNYENVLASYKGYFLNANCKSFLHKHKWYSKNKKNKT